MGRLFAELDVPLDYCSEPGLSWRIDALALLQKFLAAETDTFFLPVGGRRLMTRPKHFRHARWYAHADLGDYVMRMANWSFSPDVTAVEYEPTRLPTGSSYPNDQFIVIPNIAAGTIALLPVDMTDLEMAAGVTLPSGMAVVASTSLVPDGTASFADASNGGPGGYCPYWQFVRNPPPNDTLLFGFHNIACLLMGETFFVLRDTGQAYEDWELLGKFASTRESGRREEGALAGSMQTGIWQTYPLRLSEWSLTVIPDAPNALHLYAGKAHWTITLPRDDQDPNNGMFAKNSRAWWVAGHTGQQFMFQCQMVGYEEATYTPPTLLGEITTPMFDLGPGYMPGPYVAPADGRVGFQGEMYAPFTNLTVTHTALPGLGWLAETDFGMETEVSVVDQAGAAWVSNGTHQKGAFYLRLKPSDDTFLPTSLEYLSLHFPKVFAARATTPLALTDDQFGPFECEVSLEDPLGKRLHLPLPPNTLDLLTAAGLEKRTHYPMIISEDTNGDGVPDTARIRAWVQTEERQDERLTPDVTDAALSAGPMLRRLDAEWPYIPQLLDPDGGDVECQPAVAECLRQGGFDVDNLAWVVLTDDPFAGTEAAAIPGQTAGDTATPGLSKNAPWPRFGERMLQYAQEVARDWRGWNLYETLAQIRYDPDIQFEMAIGRPYFVSAVLYETTAAAILAGRTGQVFEIKPQRQVDPPEANFIRVSARTSDGEWTHQVVDRDEDSLTDTTYENYLGEYRARLMPSRWAIEQAGAARVARLARLMCCRRRMIRTIVVPKLAPWEFLDTLGAAVTLNPGHIITLQGLADYLILHMHLRQLRGAGPTGGANLFQTTITGLRVSESATAGLIAGEYPGAGL